MRYILALLFTLLPFFNAVQAEATRVPARPYLVPKPLDGLYRGMPIENYDSVDSWGTWGMGAEDARRLIQSCYDYAWSNYNFNTENKYGQITEFRITQLVAIAPKNHPRGNVLNSRYGGHPFLVMRMGLQKRVDGQFKYLDYLSVDCVIDRYTFEDTNKVIGFEIK